MAVEVPVRAGSDVPAGSLEQSRTDDSDPTQRLVDRLLADTREEIRRADAKASQWLAMIAAVMMAIVATSPSQVHLATEWTSANRWMWLLGLACSVTAGISLVLALVPRTRGDPNSAHVAYFGHIARISDPLLVRGCLQQAAADPVPGLVAELCWISRITRSKYRWLRTGTVFAAVAAGFVLASLL